jgi:hypothetical protein
MLVPLMKLRESWLQLKSYKSDDPRINRLQKSVDQYGVLMPLLVRPCDDGVLGIIDGTARFRVAEKIGIEMLEVQLYTPKDDLDVLKLQLHLNVNATDYEIELHLRRMTACQVNYSLPDLLKDSAVSEQRFCRVWKLNPKNLPFRLAMQSEVSAIRAYMLAELSEYMAVNEYWVEEAKSMSDAEFTHKVNSTIRDIRQQQR